MSKDYYGILGVAKTATPEEIKKAYRSLAKKFHPDRNSNDVSATERFKEIQAAYDVLSDPSKKSMFDGGSFNFRQKRPTPNPASGFAFHEVMEDFFGGSASKGRNIQVRIEIDFQESFAGCKKTVKIKKRKRCGTCTGHGFTGFQPCTHCEGTGFKNVDDAPFGFKVGCQVCGSTGKASVVKCNGCAGSGQLPDYQEKAIDISIPAGIDNGMQIRLQGEGEESLKSTGRNGDVIVFVLVKNHHLFVRENLNLSLEIPVSYTQLVLGDEIEIPTLTGDILKVKIPEGSQPHTKFRIKGRGFVVGNTHGDLVATLKVEVPKVLDDDYKKIVDQLAEIEKKNITPRREQWYKKVADNK